jgi:hypothetical protein
LHINANQAQGYGSLRNGALYTRQSASAAKVAAEDFQLADGVTTTATVPRLGTRTLHFNEDLNEYIRLLEQPLQPPPQLHGHCNNAQDDDELLSFEREAHKLSIIRAADAAVDV